MRTLAGDTWFTDQIADVGTKDSSQDLRGVWIVELSDLSSIRRAEIEKIKAYISRQVDHYRPSYGRRSIDVPRQCVFIGTTNDREWQGDITGGRRFWPVECTAIDIAAIARDREQLWAEALVAYRAGETWWLDDTELDEAARVQQERRRLRDPWETPIAEWFENPVTQPDRDGHRMPIQLDGRITIRQILDHAIGRPTERQTKSDQMRIGRVLRLLGWDKHHSNGKFWVKGGPNDEVVRPGGPPKSQADGPFGPPGPPGPPTACIRAREFEKSGTSGPRSRWSAGQ